MVLLKKDLKESSHSLRNIFTNTSVTLYATSFGTLFITLFIILMVTVLSSALSSAEASIKQWPLQSKGEIRYLKFIKVYDIALYSPSKVTSENILNTNISKCLKLDYLISLTKDKFKLATLKILKRRHSSEYLETIKGPLDSLQKAYKAVNKGDIYTLCYNGKNQMLKLELNDENLFEIKSSELAKVYLGIWLSSDQPISLPLYRKFFY